MKILWIVNMLLPDAANYLNVKTGTSGTWMFNLSKELSKDNNIELAVACVYGDKFRDFTVNNIRYFCIPGNGKTMLFYNKKNIRYWDQIEESFNPDIVHYHGTEYSHGLSYLKKYPHKNNVLTIQGILGKVAMNHWGGMSFLNVLCNRTFKENLHFNGMIERKLLVSKNVKYENEILKTIKYVTGRTDWDKFYIHSINPNAKYFRCYYDLREEFYSAPKWDINNISRNVIYASTSALTPLKGGHIVLKALALVKREIPDVKVKFLASKQKDGILIPNSGYTKIIAKLIKKYKLENNVEFVNSLDTNEVIDIMTKSNLTIIPSASENASATLREAMHLGAPCIASFRGGMIQLLDDGESGYYYDFTEFEYLAGRIIEVLKNDDIALKFSKNAIKKIEPWHDKENNNKSYIDMYKEIFQNNE